MTEQPFVAPMALPKSPKQRLADFKNELESAKSTANDLLSLVGLTSSYFKYDLIKNDPHTDISKLNFEELTTLGNTIISDYHQYKGELDSIYAEIDEFVRQVENSLTLPSIPEEMLEMYMLQSSLIHASYTDWVMHYNMTVILSINMAISIHNAARPADKQLNYILMGEESETSQ